MVLYCIENNKAIEELDMSEFKSFSELIEEDVYEEISLSKCVSGRNLPEDRQRKVSWLLLKTA